METMEQRYISNNMRVQFLASSPLENMKASLEQVLKTTPPKKSYSNRELGGLFSGYTGLAYLFLRLSAGHPDLTVMGHNLRFWAESYLDGDRGSLVLESGNCGLASEKLSFLAVLCCLTKDLGHLKRFLGDVPLLLGPYPPSQGDPFPSEMIYGRAGTLYLIRMIKQWVPEFAPLLESPTLRIAEVIMRTDDDGQGNWEWHGKRYYGAAHGEIGIITQLVLSVPSLAVELAPRLEDLLRLQLQDGNWPSSEKKRREGKPAKLLQWCHGAPGFIYSLEALRPYFPRHQDDIDFAIEKARELIWRHGILVKEPSLCHGLFGNALVLPCDARREHFLALASTESVEKVRGHDPELFAPASYGKGWAVLLTYHASAAWAWAVCGYNTPLFSCTRMCNCHRSAHYLLDVSSG
ncbi:hypothetical protein V2G26_016925 [Clonostachys chloroleuca]